MERKIAVPGEKRILLVFPAPGLDGRTGPAMFQWEGFVNPNETMTRMEVAHLLLLAAGGIVQNEYEAAIPKELTVPVAGLSV